MQLGVLEGFFGPPWSWEARERALPFLQAFGFTLDIYAPKADRHLRGRWRERHPPAEEANLRRWAEQCGTFGVDAGVGLSLLGLFETWGQQGRADLLRRVDELRALGLTNLGLFFDDMRGDLPGLAETQAAMVRAVHEAHPDLPLRMCPTYYTTHSVLDRVFGQRPPRYLETLGEGLPEAVEVFWTGSAVCSTHYALDELLAVREQLGRPLAIWDNYPVNDGPRMCKRLHLKPPEGRGPELAKAVQTWCCNPMNQPVASQLPLAAIAQSLRGGLPTTRLADQLYGVDAAALLRRWMSAFQVDGLDVLPIADALADFASLDGPLAQEVRDWLEGRYLVGPECLTDTED